MTHYAPMVAALISMLLIFVLLQSKAGKEIQDVPNERSLHAIPVPRIGGVGLLAGVLAGWALMFKSLTWWLVMPAILLFVVSLVDDMKGLPVRQRLAAHGFAALIAVAGSGLLTHNPLLALGVLVAVIWMTNLYNFMDGSDGLAGGMTFFGFTCYGAASLMHGEDTQAMINFTVAAGAMGFLYHNFHPAKVFMGDAGSIPLGFLAAAMGLLGWLHGTWPAWFPVLVFSPFIVDATVTLAKRTLRRAKVTEAHREHYYQRLVQMGWGHRNVALAEYVLMLAAGGSGLWAERQSAGVPWLLLAAWAAVYAIIMLVLDSRWKAFRGGCVMTGYNPRTLLAFSHDILAAALAWCVAYLLRFNFELPREFAAGMWHTLIWVAPLQGAVFWGLGLYRGIWRYASVADLRRILLAVATSAALVAFILWMFRLNEAVPRSVLVISPLLLLIIMGGSRFAYRMWKEQGFARGIKLQGEPVLVLGAGDAAMGLSRELVRSRDWRLVGFLDDNAAMHGLMLNGIKVLGDLDTLRHWAERMDVAQAIIAMPTASHQERKRAIDICTAAGIKVLTVPSFDDLMSGRVAISQLRAIELDDLLGRDPVQLDDAGLHALLTGKTVMVTGAGGSIGSELCRQIARFRPKVLLLFEQSEFALYLIEQELRVSQPDLACEFLIGDIRDGQRLDDVMGLYRPAVVFHAAAYKHVPLMEQRNAWQAVRNNVLGTWCVASAAQRHGASKFVLISTDKAVNPTNVMGATKRLAEMMCQGLQQPVPDGGTRFVMVRFGNVLGSNGSVIPKFREQIAKGGPVTVTHPEITRFFMSIPEAAQLVLQAGLMGNGGEIFVLDMGEPVKIVDLAKELIHLSGFSEDEIKIEFTGLRPGEKLYEELLADSEHTLPTQHPKLRIAQCRPVDQESLQQILAWASAGGSLDDAAVKRAIKQWVPEYAPDTRKG